jgi:flagellar L-ring protein FlgH
MNALKRLLILLFLLITSSSCSNYIAKMHKELDRGSGVKRPVSKRDKFDFYRRRQKRLSNKAKSHLAPKVKRKYSEVKKRYTADDLNDNGPDGSLWTGDNGRNKFLFTSDQKKRSGDILLIQVAGTLKDEITNELKRAFPSSKRKPKKGDAKEAPKKEEAQAAKKEEGGEGEDGKSNPDKIYDKISSVVVEEISYDHLLIRGRKNLLYKNRKRIVEVQAMVARRDIANDDTVHSDNILESNIRILR